MQKNKIIVATRPSKLAYNQSLQTIRLLKIFNPNTEFTLKKFSTKGDDDLGKPLTAFWGTGIFVKELEQALLNGQADMAIHSMKDVPANKQTENLIFCSFPEREDPRDVFLTSYQGFKKKIIVGTGSPRRKLQIAQIHKNATFQDIRGNIDTRIRKLENNKYDAIILAAAGLNRLNIKYNKNELLSIKQCLPAVGQGTIGIQCRENDNEVIKIAKKINHIPTEKTIMAERIFLEYVRGGCKFPIAGYAYIEKYDIILETLIGDLKTYKYVRKKEKFPANFCKNEINKFAKKLLRKAKKQDIYIC